MFRHTKHMLLNTGTEEIGHIEMLATAVALNLETAPSRIQSDRDAVRADPADRPVAHQPALIR